MNIELVIFDCDGVLVDSEPLANAIFAESLNAIGYATTYDRVFRDFRGLSMRRCIERVERRLGRAVPPRFVDDLQRRTFEAFRRSLRPVPGVAEALERIELPFCVASSGEPAKMRLTLGLTGLLPLFEGRLFSAADVGRGKPFPDLFLHAAESLGVEPSAAVVVEDAVPGVQAARAAGMRVLGYAAGPEARELADAGAAVFDSMRDLPGLLQKLRDGCEAETG